MSAILIILAIVVVIGCIWLHADSIQENSKLDTRVKVLEKAVERIDSSMVTKDDIRKWSNSLFSQEEEKCEDTMPPPSSS